MKKVLFILFVLGLLGCSSDNSDDIIETPIMRKVSGVIEKGPFVQGSIVTLYELDNSLKPTGKSYTTSVKNDEGAFDFGELNLVSKLVKLSISGFYFNEVEGKNSTSPIVLSAYSNVEDKSTINVNILTHLELERVANLVKDGDSFSKAKTQARKEVLDAFSIDRQIELPENISIISNTEDSKVLIAISSIMLKDNTDASLTQMLSRFGQDIADNGVVDDENIKNHIKAVSLHLPIESICSNIIEYYKVLGKKVEVSDFSNYVAGLSQGERPIDESSMVKIKVLLSLDSGNNPRALVPDEVGSNEKYIIKKATIITFNSKGEIVQSNTFSNIPNAEVIVELKGLDVVKDNKLRFVAIINDSGTLNYNVSFDRLYNLVSYHPLEYSTLSNIPGYGVTTENEIKKQLTLVTIKVGAAVSKVEFEIDKVNSSYLGSYEDILLSLSNIYTSGYVFNNEVLANGNTTITSLKDKSSALVYPSKNVNCAVTLNIGNEIYLLSNLSTPSLDKNTKYKYVVTLSGSSPTDVKAKITLNSMPLIKEADIEI